MRCKNCGGELVKKYNIEYHKLGKVIQLSEDEFFCPKCHKPTEIAGEDFECFVCDRKIENSPKNRVRVITGKTSYIPKTWGICPDCSVA